MTMRLVRLIALLLAACALPQPSQALARADGEGATGAAAPLGDWRVGPVVTKDGAFAYCIAESRFDNGQSLVIARSRQGEINIGLGMPSAHLSKGAAWTVTVAVDDDFKRERQAVAADPDMLVIANGADSRLLDALTHGDKLTIRGPKDTIAFQLKNTNKAMPALKTCVEQARAGRPAAALGAVSASSLQLPPVLKQLLAEAGFKKLGLMTASAAPRGLGPADYLWKVETVTAGMAETRSERNRSLGELADAVLDRLRPRCARDFTVRESESANLPGGSFRSTEVACTTGSGATSTIAFLFQLGRAGLFKQFFFEAPTAEAAKHDRDAVASVLKQAESR